jgi:hypothetical protein
MLNNISFSGNCIQIKILPFVAECMYFLLVRNLAVSPIEVTKDRMRRCENMWTRVGGRGVKPNR